MARGEYVLNIGDDNVVLTRLVDKKVANAWLGSPDPAMAHEELGEALAEDTKGAISVIIDTLDQSFKEEELPRVGVLDRRKVLARHINMAFPGANLRGARLVTQTQKKTLIYELASVPLDGRIPGWVDFIESLPNEKRGYFAIAPENVDMVAALAPKDAAVEEGKTHWRHLIGVNVTGGLRQIIEKNGRLCLTRLTQAPPPETPPADFADMIIRDFKATITYIRRLGYQVGDVLDLVVLTTVENKAVLEELEWDSARSVSVYTPYEAGALLGLGSIGREDQAYSDVLHASWFASKRRAILPLTRSLAMGGTKDDIRDLAYLAAPYAAGLAAVLLVGWSGWTGYQLYDYSGRNAQLEDQLSQQTRILNQARTKVGGLPYEAARVHNILDVDAALDAGHIDLVPILHGLSQVLQSDAVVVSLKVDNGAFGTSSTAATAGRPGAQKSDYTVTVKMKLADVITKAEEATATARTLETRLNTAFGKAYAVQMTVEPVAAQAATSAKGGLADADMPDASSARQDEPFFTEFSIAKGGWKVKTPQISIKLPDLPRNVATSAVVLAAAALAFGGLLPTLGAARDRSVSQNKQLQSDITQTTKRIADAQQDYKFVTDNLEKYEAVLQSDRLIPHTRRDAEERMRKVALENGIKTLTWDIAALGAHAPAAAASQATAKSASYQLSDDNVSLKIAGPLDGPIYRFLADLTRDFPGAMVISSVSLTKAQPITSEMIDALSKGANGDFVQCDAKFVWRTAQANDQKKTP